MIRRGFIALSLSALLVLAGGAMTPATALANDHGERSGAFIKDLAGDALASLTAKDISRKARIERFRGLFRQHFAVTAIGRWVLGRHWRKASDTERAEYLKLFEELIVATYVERFSSYAGEKLAVRKTVEQGAQTAIVYSEIVQPAGELAPESAIGINWRVDDGGKIGFKITDVIVEGTSMSQTMRSDFASTIRAKGNGIAGLLDVLREKTISLQAETTN